MNDLALGISIGWITILIVLLIFRIIDESKQKNDQIKNNK